MDTAYQEFMKLYESLLNKSNVDLHENLILKKIKIDTTDDKGETVSRWRFLVDSDLADRSSAGHETYKNKEKIKKAGFFWNKEHSKWMSSDSYSDEELSSAMRDMKQKILSLNKDFESRPIEEIEDDIEEYLDKGITDQMAAFFEEMKAQIMQQKNSPEIQEFLKFRLKFTNRSFNNQILIWIQARARGIDPTHLEGKKTWMEKFGRRLKKGARHIKIYVPLFNKEGKKATEDDVPEKDADANAEVKTLKGFTYGKVYDISDTEPIEGKEHLYAKAPKWYDDTTPSETTRYIYDALLEFAKENSIQVSVSQDGLGQARGVSFKGSIQLMQENISTMIHELTHEVLHTVEKRLQLTSEIKELQAEGVSYLVLRQFGLPSKHAEVYLALWVKDPDNIKQNEEVIRKTAKMFIDYINDKAMEIKSEERSAQQEQASAPSIQESIDQYLDMLIESENEEESFDKKMNDFILFAKDYLNLQEVPEIEFLEQKEDDMTSAVYDPASKTVKVIRNGRAFFDICRSVAHELVHRSQHEEVKDGSMIDGTAGSEDENEANALAGEMIRVYGENNAWFYEE